MFLFYFVVFFCFNAWACSCLYLYNNSQTYITDNTFDVEYNLINNTMAYTLPLPGFGFVWTNYYWFSVNLLEAFTDDWYSQSNKWFFLFILTYLYAGARMFRHYLRNIITMRIYCVWFRWPEHTAISLVLLIWWVDWLC